MYKRILIAYDGSKEAERALAEGLELASVTRGDVVIATIAEPLPGYYNVASLAMPGFIETAKGERLEELHKLQQKAIWLASEVGAKIKTTLVEDQEVEGILNVARSIKADLLVVGLRRHVKGLEWAGTVRQIANETPCTILAVA